MHNNRVGMSNKSQVCLPYWRCWTNYFWSRTKVDCIYLAVNMAVSLFPKCYTNTGILSKQGYPKNRFFLYWIAYWIAYCIAFCIAYCIVLPIVLWWQVLITNKKHSEIRIEMRGGIACGAPPHPTPTTHGIAWGSPCHERFCLWPRGATGLCASVSKTEFTLVWQELCITFCCYPSVSIPNTWIRFGKTKSWAGLIAYLTKLRAVCKACWGAQ